MDSLASICICVHNQARFIVACLDSALIQDETPIEICIIDSGSTDGTADIIEKWIADHPGAPIRFWRHPLEGISKTYNDLIRLSKGDSIVWLDGDDLLEAGCVRKQLAYLSEHPEKSAVFGDSRLIDATGTVLRASVYWGFHWASRTLFKTNFGLRVQLLGNWCMSDPGMTVKRSVYDELGFYDESIFQQDYEFCLRLLARNQLGYLDSVVGECRLHDKNISRDPKNRVQILYDFLPIARRHAALFPPFERMLMYSFAVAAHLRGFFFALKSQR